MTGVVFVAGYANRERLGLKVASVNASVPPKAAQTPPPSKRQTVAFTGEATWALSALPECFVERSKSTARTLEYVLAHLPKDVQMVRLPQTLHYVDCTVRVKGETIYVDRGNDRLRIPPPARLYAGGRHLALLLGTEGGFELRVYTIATPTGSH